MTKTVLGKCAVCRRENVPVVPASKGRFVCSKEELVPCYQAWQKLDLVQHPESYMDVS